jgi:hypothetical protein
MFYGDASEFIPSVEWLGLKKRCKKNIKIKGGET